MDITPEELKHLQELGQQIANGEQLGQVTVTIVQKGKEKQLTFTHPFFMQLFETAALEVYRQHIPIDHGKD